MERDILAMTEKNKIEALEKILEEKERKLNELKTINSALDKASMYASTDGEGRIIQISSKFKKMLKLKGDQSGLQIQSLLGKDFETSEKLSALFQKVKIKIWNGEFEIIDFKGNVVHLNVSIVPIYKNRMNKEFLILCSDISTQIQTQKQLQTITQEKFENEIELQKINSAQVVNAQEEERKRIARDIHDGIGQMLTALKFNLESLENLEGKEIKGKVEELQKLTFEIIKEVRATTFNLTPPELSDYGVVSGIKKMTKLFGRLLNRNIEFIHRDDKIVRFEPEVEINLYRIVQEGLNNSLKYSDATIIVVQIINSEHMMSIKIEDNGQGFSKDTVGGDKSEDIGGYGLENMKERAKFINARVFVRSSQGAGTTITINIPIKSENDYE